MIAGVKTRRALLLAGVGAISAMAAHAQTAAPDGAAPSGERAAAPAAAEPGEIVVTAQRRAERLSRVPISVSAFTSQALEARNIKSFADVAKFTPGIQFNTDRGDIAIRGVSSQAGTGTTGIYIDDTPIQVRALGLNANNTLPQVFDLDRVEVLRGPQGTLFGAGSEGGTVRYITPQPSLDTYSIFARAEGSATEHGSPNYEGGVALGGPLIRDVLGFRASAWYRHDGGYVNRVDYRTGRTTERDANYTDTYVLRAALGWAPAGGLKITPAIFYQDRKLHNDDNYWTGISHRSNGDLLSGTPDRQSDRDHFVLPSIKIDYERWGVHFVSNTSYYDRREIVNGYSGTLYNLSLLQQLIGAQTNFNGDDNSANQIADPGRVLLTPTGIDLPELPGYTARTFVTNQQQNFTQEVRVQSSGTGRFQWVAGVFYTDNRQLSQEEIRDPQLPQLIPLLFGVSLSDFSLGTDLLANGDSYINRTVGYDSQTALFADATWEFVPRLKASVGLRYAWTSFRFVNFADGPQNLGFSEGNGGKKENPFTPKFNLSFQATPNDLYYATVSKGFRIGGANPPFPQSACQADLDALGITTVPATYNSDSVWNYEIGLKNKFFDRKVSLSASAFYLKWNNIQQANYLTSCGFQYTGNLGEVESKGFDAQIAFNPTRALAFDIAFGYTEARYSKTTLTGGAGSPALTTKGNTIPGVVPWSLSVGAQYNFDLTGHEAYLRTDYEFASRNPYLTPTQDIRNATNDPALINDPARNQLAVRAAVTFGRVQAQAFVENVLDERPLNALTHQDQFTQLFEAQTLRPRTFGAALSYRY